MPQLLPLSNVGSNVFQRTAVDCVGSEILNLLPINYGDASDNSIKPVTLARLRCKTTTRGTEKFRSETHCVCNLYCEIEAGLSTMVPVTKFFELVMPSLQGCPFSMVEQAILNSCAEFCEKTSIWRQDSKPTDIYADTARYAFAPAPGAQVCTAEAVRIDGKKIQDTDINTLTMLDPNWVNKKGAEPQMYFFDTSYSITLIPTPTEDKLAAMNVSVVLKPTKNAKMVPSVLYNDWAEAIAAGALKRLLAMRGKAWANEALVPMYERDFRAGISRAKSKSEKSWSRTTKDMYSEQFYN